MSLMNASPEQVFYLTDLALFPQAHRQMFEADDTPTYQLLYLQTAYHQHAMHGPLLILPSMPRAEDRLAGWVEKGVAIAIHSHRPFAMLVDHWRSLTQVRRQEAPPALFRYADARLYAGLESSLGDGDIVSLLGPARLMHGVAAGHAWRLESPGRLPPLSGDDFILTRKHERAIQAWREDVFCRQMADEHGLSAACVSAWLGQMQELALPTEHAQWEGCRTLAEAGWQHPLSPQQMDVLRRQAGPWQQRLAQLREQIATSHNADEVIS